MRIQKRLLAPAVSVGILTPASCLAAAGAQALANFVSIHIIQQALLAFWGISAAALFYYTVRMIVEADKDEAYTNISNAFIHVLTGFAIIAIAGAFASAFFTTSLSTDNVADISPSLLNIGIQSIADFMITMSAGIFVLIVVLAGLRMALSQGDQGEFDKWRKILVANIIGVVVMLVASFIVGAVSGAAPGLIIEELRGIALFLLTLIGFLCAVAVIVAGILLIVSIDESYRDKAKNIVIGTLITLAIVIVSYALISTFV